MSRTNSSTLRLELSTITRDELLAAAIAELELERERVEEKCRELQELIHPQPDLDAFTRRQAGRPRLQPRTDSVSMHERTTAGKVSGRGRGQSMSADGRARIAAAQKKRWAAYHKASKANKSKGTGKSAVPKSGKRAVIAKAKVKPMPKPKHSGKAKAKAMVAGVPEQAVA